jgi:hypothetical protein
MLSSAFALSLSNTKILLERAITFLDMYNQADKNAQVIISKVMPPSIIFAIASALVNK